MTNDQRIIEIASLERSLKLFDYRIDNYDKLTLSDCLYWKKDELIYERTLINNKLCQLKKKSLIN